MSELEEFYNLVDEVFKMDDAASEFDTVMLKTALNAEAKASSSNETYTPEHQDQLNNYRYGL